ncbi:MAG: energy transducer TonB [Candidatus Korobacteraceae bacterium]
MTQFKKQLFSLVVVAGVLAPAAFAGSKEEAHDLLSKSFQQAGIWNQDPVKLVAQVRMPVPNGQDLSLQYTVSWAGPDKWRAEWTAPGLEQITVLNNGKLSYVSNQPAPLVRAVQFEAAIAALDGGTPAGPYSLSPLDYQKAKIDVSKKKINGADAKCLAFGQPAQTLCIDPANGHLLSVDGDLGTFEYGDYTTVGSNAYPQSVKVTYVKTLMEDGKVTVTRGEKFADALFSPPDGSTTVDFASCANVDKNFSAPRLDKPVTAKMPDAARKAKKYGVVWVLAAVGKDGTVQKTTVLGGEADLSSAATDAVKQYRFTPYVRCGQAVEYEKVVVVPFAPPPQAPPEINVSPR